MTATQAERHFIGKKRYALLYKIYDANGDLLYVGSTTQRISSRIADHRAQRTWFSEAVEVAVHPYATREAALVAERAAVLAECPRYNERLPQTTTEEDLGFRLRSARVAAGLSQAKLGELTGLAQNKVSTIETGTAELFRLDEIRTLAAAVGVTPGWLAFGDQ